jgi:hypothetical protein
MRAAVCVIVSSLALYAARVPMAVSAPEPGVVWLFLVDDLHIDFRTTGIVRGWLRSLTDALIEDDDVFAVRTTGPSSLSVGLLASVDDLRNGIRRLSGSALKAEDVQRAPHGPDEIVHRARVTIKAATELLSSAPGQDPRRRGFVYFGKGFDAGNAVDVEMDEFLAEARRHHVTVIAIDASALPGAQTPIPSLANAERMRGVNARRYSLERLALPTGGFVLDDQDALRDAVIWLSSALR